MFFNDDVSAWHSLSLILSGVPCGGGEMRAGGSNGEQNQSGYRKPPSFVSKHKNAQTEQRRDGE